MKINRQFLCCCLFILPLIMFSQDGSLDTSFGDNGSVTTDFFGESDTAWNVADQNDGKKETIYFIFESFL